MLSSISPLGERARNSRWWLTTAAYLLGSLAGGLALGGLAGAARLRRCPTRCAPRAWTLARGRRAAARRARLRPARRASRCRRGAARSTWPGSTRYRGWVYGVGFGAQLGFGLVTIITSATTYAVVLLAALTGHLGAGLAIGATFGRGPGAALAAHGAGRRPRRPAPRLHPRRAMGKSGSRSSLRWLWEERPRSCCAAATSGVESSG